ncbi:MAG: hypothetical protein ACNYPE_00090 [Candidatus Azotimanducaceae bacterium WSBS_2022_MAG_OTU7]
MQACWRRNVALLAESEHVNTASKEFLNRLSDYLFVVARSCARITGVDEVLLKRLAIAHPETPHAGISSLVSA